MPADLAPLLATLPEEAHELCRGFWTEAVASPAALRMEVRAWHSRMHTLKDSHELVDTDLGDALAATCLRMLHWLATHPSDDHHRLVHLACRYLACDEDGESDFDSVLGLDDDAMVINEIAGTLGHPEWQVAIPG